MTSPLISQFTTVTPTSLLTTTLTDIYSPVASTTPTPVSVQPRPPACPSRAPYQYAVAVLGTIIGVTTALLAFVFLYMKPKKWKKQGAATRDVEMEHLKKENEDHKNASKGNGGYERVPGVAVPLPVPGAGGIPMGLRMEPRTWW